MNRPALLVVAVLAAGSVAGCGGGVDAPTNATVDDFCAGYVSVFKDVAGESGDITAEQIKAWGADLEKTGTPRDISEDERAGFEIVVEFAGDLDEGASGDDLQEPKVSEDEQQQVDDFLAYTQEKCADALAQAASGG
jgi:hypothetical protein